MGSNPCFYNDHMFCPFLSRPEEAFRGAALLAAGVQGRPGWGPMPPAPGSANTSRLLAPERPQGWSGRRQELPGDRRGPPDRGGRSADRLGQLLLRGGEHREHQDQRPCSHHGLR